MRRHIGLDVVEIDVDTDQLGTFAGEIPRRGTPWETAVAKARLGMERSGRRLGLASEGSVGPDPHLPFVVSDVELVVLVDDDCGIVVGETELMVGLPVIAVDVTPDELTDLALDTAGFPTHGLIVRPSHGFDPVVKGVHELGALRRAVALCAAHSSTGSVRIESDLRAHHHPSRREVIAAAARRLARRLACRCPSCSAPGWGIERLAPGAPCRLCGRATRRPLLELWRCAACDHVLATETPAAAGVDPAQCAHCNP